MHYLAVLVLAISYAKLTSWNADMLVCLTNTLTCMSDPCRRMRKGQLPEPQGRLYPMGVLPRLGCTAQPFAAFKAS